MAGCTGLEPATRGLTVRCSTDWANNPWIAVIVLQDVVLPMGLEPIEKHILSVPCLPIPPQEHIVTVFTNCQTFGAQSGTWTRTPKHWYLKPACLPIPPFGHGALAGTWTPNLPIKSRLLCQLSYKHLLRVYHIVLGNADWLFWRRHALRQNFGGPWWVRTINQAVMSRLLYQLS